MAKPSVRQFETVTSNIKSVAESAMEAKGLLRLASTWVPGSFLQPGKRLKLDPKDLYKPKSYYFPPQHNNVGNSFPYTFFEINPNARNIGES